jgi:hypothetical protein
VVSTVGSFTDRAYCKQQCHFVCTAPFTVLSVSQTIIIVIIIVIAIPHQLGSIGLFRSSPIVYSKAFEVIFVHLVYNSVLFLASCGCSSLLHVAASLICVFLVSRQLFLFPTLPKFLEAFCGQKRVYRLFF